MKKILCLAAALLALNLAPVWGQPDPFAKAADPVTGKPADAPLQKAEAKNQRPPQKKIQAAQAPATGTKLDPAASGIVSATASAPPPAVQRKAFCQFYSLAPYLDRGFTADGLTTAIQAGWKLAGETAPPELNYHPETRVLIAYGEPDKLKVIGAALKSLDAAASPTTQGLAGKIQVEELQRRETIAEKIAKKIPAARTASLVVADPLGKKP